PFVSHLFDVDFIPLPNQENLESVLLQFEHLLRQQNVAAFIFEPLVQGAGGMRFYEAAHLDQLLALARRYGVLTIADEVMTGFGRLGTLFASLQLEYMPDIVCLSKGLTGGAMPMGVTSCSQEVYQAFYVDDFYKTFFHGHSYTANPLACAVANASLDLLLSETCQQQIAMIAEAHREFGRVATAWKNVRNVRHKGTILALELDTTTQTSYFNEARSFLYPLFIEQGVLLRPLGNTIYVLPPYCITPEELTFVYSAIEKVVGRYRAD
ncbi:MAG: aminotransferase class III-fold pyridoxal phosphate-dependent enzyme, partial [Flammeovirgaceae bacterium]|nr:aminotransferase class III-fold pyridoxal phosphate-dependent enzyme [Flammeovirgaceae bacterium]